MQCHIYAKLRIEAVANRLLVAALVEPASEDLDYGIILWKGALIESKTISKVQVTLGQALASGACLHRGCFHQSNQWVYNMTSALSW